MIDTVKQELIKASVVVDLVDKVVDKVVDFQVLIMVLDPTHVQRRSLINFSRKTQVLQVFLGFKDLIWMMMISFLAYYMVRRKERVTKDKNNKMILLE